MSSFSIIDDNASKKYKVGFVPIFEISQSSWNNSSKTNAFNIISSSNQSVLFTGYLSWKNIISSKVTISGAVSYSVIYTTSQQAKAGMFVDAPGVIQGTYITFILIAGSSRYLYLSQPATTYSGNITLIETTNYNYYFNPPNQLEIKIRFNLHGQTNYTYESLKFPNSTKSHSIVVINFVKTFTEMGLYDVYIMGTDITTDSNDTLYLNATLCDIDTTDIFL